MQQLSAGSRRQPSPVLQLLHPQPRLLICAQQIVLHQTDATPHAVQVDLATATAAASTAAVCQRATPDVTIKAAVLRVLFNKHQAAATTHDKA